MPTYKRVRIDNNLVRVPRLPIPLTLGTLDWSKSFEGFPSASIKYEGVAQEDIRRYEQSYQLCRELTIFGIPFFVKSYGYTRSHYPYEKKGFDVFEVSIDLEWKWSEAVGADLKVKKIVKPTATFVTLSDLARAAKIPYQGPRIEVPLPPEADADFTLSVQGVASDRARVLECFIQYDRGISLVKLGRGRSWNFPFQKIVTDGENVLSVPTAYKNAELTWGDDGDNEDAGDRAEEEAAGVEFVRQEPDVQVLFENDSNPQRPPAGSKVLRDLSSNFDASGRKKTSTRSVYVNGTIVEQSRKTYGFAYTAEDIYQYASGELRGNPGTGWQTIEKEKTAFIYQQTPPVVLTLVAKDPDPINSFSRPVQLLLHPDYAQFAEVAVNGRTASFSGAGEYLVGETSTGSRLIRFKKESEALESLDGSDSPYYKLYQFKWASKFSRKAYELFSTRVQYGDDTGLPFSIEWVNYEEAEPRIQKLLRETPALGVKKQSDSGKIGILIPDPNYVEPFFVRAESQASSSFAYTQNPDYEHDPDNPDPTQKYLVTGEESYQSVVRYIINDKLYTEFQKTFSAQDGNFGKLAETTRSVDKLGRPPGGSSRSLTYEEKEKEGSRSGVGGDSAPKPPDRYLLTTDGADKVFEGGSLSYPAATSLEEAKKAAMTDLVIGDLQDSQQSKTLAWFYPTIKPGDIVTTGRDRFSDFGRWVVVDASFSIRADGKNNHYGLAPLAVTEGTQLRLGLWRRRSIEVEKVDGGLPDDLANPTPPSDPTLEVDASGSPSAMGAIFGNNPHRRSF